MSSEIQEENETVAVIICNEHRFLVDDAGLIWRWTNSGWRLFDDVEGVVVGKLVEDAAKRLFHLYGWKISEINLIDTGDKSGREMRSIMKQFGDPGVEIVGEDL